MAVVAVQAIRRMRGGAQSQLMLGSDEKLWVVKFQNNPQHMRVLANDLIGTRLAAAAGLTVPRCDVVEVTEWLVNHTPEMYVELGRGQRARCAAGLQFGSQFVGGLMPGQVMDYLPESQMDEDEATWRSLRGCCASTSGPATATGGRRCLSGRPREKQVSGQRFIDQGFCFNAGEWTFPDSPLRGVYGGGTGCMTAG